MRLTLTPTLSRKRERGRVKFVISPGGRGAGPVESLLPLAGEGGPKDQMRVSRCGKLLSPDVR
jgi:hypothetical protein